MKEYRVMKASGDKQAEKIMNEMAADGWEVVDVTFWNNFTALLLITFSREKDN